jgi:hypothetical protein
LAQSDPGIQEVLGKLAAEDPAVAQAAGVALSWVTAGGGTARITQERVQRFLWYDLPLKVGADTPTRQALANALGQALDLLGLPRYADICRSSTTAGVLAAYEDNPQRGLAAFRQANLASGIYPLDLPEFRWGATMGLEEARALSAVQDYLELAVAAGELVPGARGWKSKQARLVRSFINAPSFQLGGQTPLSVTLTERIQTWIGIEPSPTRRRLLSGLANRLLHSIELPPGTFDPYPPLSWLLGHMAEGIRLTDKRKLDPAFLEEAAPRFGWELSTPPAEEEQLTDLHILRRMTQTLRLARRSGKQLMLTRKGRALLEDPLTTWRMVPEAFLSGNTFSRLAGELFFAQLIDEESLPLDQVVSTIGQAVEEANYREAGTGLPPARESILRALQAALNQARALGLFAASPSYEERRVGLTPVGKATALQALRSWATAPGSVPLR